MEHDFLDKYARQDGLLQGIPSKTKVLAALSLVVLFVSTPPALTGFFAFYYILMFSLVLASKVPLNVVLRRFLVVSPFILLASTSLLIAGDFSPQAIKFYAIVLSKSVLSVSVLILLTATTEFRQLLKGLKWLGTPKPIVMTLSFLYRYLFLLSDEIMRIKRARKARTINESKLSSILQAGTIVGELFIRSYERSERVYSAMVSRGFTGDFVG